MSFLFGGKKKTPQGMRRSHVSLTTCSLTSTPELMREYKRNVDKSVREIEREKTKLQTQEKKIINDIRKAAKEGQMVKGLYQSIDIIITAIVSF